MRETAGSAPAGFHALGLWVLLALPLVAGCKRTKPAGTDVADAHLGTRKVPGRFEDLRVSPDGALATYLAHARKPEVRGLPPQMVIGELWALPLLRAKGQPTAPQLLGEGVTNLPGGYLRSPDSRWMVLLEGYNVAAGAGVAKAVRIGGKASSTVTLGSHVSHFAISPDSRWVAVVDGGKLKLFTLGSPDSTELASNVSTVAFSPDSRTLMFRQSVSAGGGLWVASIASPKRTRKLSDRVTDAAFSPDASHLAFTRRSPTEANTRDLLVTSLGAKGWSPPEQLGHGTDQFAFSPDGRWLARSEGWRPDAPGSLVVGPASGGKGRTFVAQVHSFRFAPNSKAIAAIVHYENRFRAGRLALASLPNGKVEIVGQRVGYYGWDPKGHWVAFSARLPDPPPILSYDLFLAEIGKPKARKLVRGGYGFLFSRDGSRLLFRTRCTRGGRGCDLDVLELNDPKGRPRATAEQVFSFDLSADGRRILYTFAHPTSTRLYDAQVFDLKTGKGATVGRNALLPPKFAGNDGSKVVYLEGDLDRPGLYVADRVP